MTTPEAAAHYEAEHLASQAGKNYAVYNPLGLPLDRLPVIYGFNNGGNFDTWFAQLLAQDGTPLGNHICSSEAYMPADLGILEGTRPDRHHDFRAHYPDGYRMDFVPYDEIDNHAELQHAFDLARQREAA